MTDVDITAAFPELDAIEDAELRAGTRRAWELACADAGVETTDDLRAFPWFPPVQRDLDLPDERLVPHVRDVAQGALALADVLRERRGDRLDLDVDLLVAGALVHDVSKLYEFDGLDPTPVYDLLGHPYYGIQVVARADLPVECAHVVLSHSRRTPVEPATLEAELVRRADEAAATTIRSRALDDLRKA